MVAFLEKSTGSEGFHQVIDFLIRSHICYALTKKPDVCVSFIKQFWRSSEVTTADNGEVKITIRVLEDDLKTTKQTYSSAFTKLILRVKKLEAQIKTRKARRRARIVHSDDEDIADDSSKQGRNYLDAEVQEKASNETEPVIQDVTPTKVIQDQESSEKGQSEVSTAGAKQEGVKKKDNEKTRKAIMTEPEPKKKSKKEIEQERLSLAKAIRLQEQMDEAQRAQIARDEEIARQWEEEERQRGMSEAKSSQKIDWNDPQA
ncbi:hypothetical protein Tco_0464088 [Tanacetum coccineum]